MTRKTLADAGVWRRRGPDSALARRVLPSEVMPRQSHPRASATPRRIVVIEDDCELRRLIRSVLSDDGWDIADAGSAEALAQLLSDTTAEKAPELVICDVRLPGQSGPDVVESLRKLSVVTPVLFITAFPSRETAERIGAIQSVALLAKPFDIDDLRTIVANLAVLKLGVTVHHAAVPSAAQGE